MAKFIFALDEKAADHQVASVLAGLQARFPQHAFKYAADLSADMPDSIIPVFGAPHPTEPGITLMKEVPQHVVAEVREVFKDLLRQARAARLN